MSSRIIIVLMWIVASAVGLGAFVVGTSAFDRYAVSDPPEPADSTLDGPAADDGARTRRYDGIRNTEPN
jgi:hypothetical protein